MQDYSNTKVIGFDLDQTLYPKSAEVDGEIQKYIYQRISEFKKCSIDEAHILFTSLYKNGVGLSGSKTLEALGVPNGKEIVQEALERANIASVLIPDERMISLLQNLKGKFGNIDLLTGSNDSNAFIKLEKLSINKEIFGTILTADDSTKSDGSMYKIWMSKYDLLPENFLYIGDRIQSDYQVPYALGIKSILVNVTEQNDSLDCLQLSSLLDLEKYLF